MSKIEERRGGLKRRATLPIVFTLCMSLLLAACGSSKTHANQQWCGISGFDLG